VDSKEASSLILEDGGRKGIRKSMLIELKESLWLDVHGMWVFLWLDKPRIRQGTKQ